VGDGKIVWDLDQAQKGNPYLLAVHAQGQSGRVASSHYDDLIDLWLNGEYHPMLWTRQEIEREAEGKLGLCP